MKNLEKILVSFDTTIRDALKIIDDGAVQIAVVVDETKKLLGTVTDGDIRRGMLRGIGLDEPVNKVMNNRPVTQSGKYKKAQLLSLMKEKQLHQIPVVDSEFRVIELVTLDELLQQKTYDNWVVIMAGGLGSRLGEMTKNCPKPLLNIGGKPILETIIESFREDGFKNIFLAVNYKAEMIEQYFGDGADFGVNIRYIRENERLGTAGALSLLPEIPDKPIIVMNGDLLTKINFQQMLEYHMQSKATATMCVRNYTYQVPYGVLQIEDDKIKCIEEKPIQSFFVSAGVYVLEPSALKYVPKSQYFDMPRLFDILMLEGREIKAFPIREYWMDIGQRDEFDRANADYFEFFKGL